MDLQTPVPTIDLAVSMRHLSSLKQERIPAAIVPPSAPALDDTHTEALILQVRRSLRATLMIVFAQGLALLHTASQRFKYRLKLQEITAIWRGGCIIRTALLDQIRQIYEHTPELPNLLLDPTYTREITGLLGDQRQLVSLALQQALPVPAFMSAIAWFDAYRSPWLPANLVQAQRDYFGSHGYRRIDQPGTFHTDWQQQTVLS